MTVIVTGGAGFIGSALVRALVADGERVITVDKLTYAGNLDNLASVPPADHVFVHADVCDRAAMAGVFAEHRPHAVYHLAAESHVDRSIDGPMRSGWLWSSASIECTSISHPRRRAIRRISAASAPHAITAVLIPGTRAGR